MSRSAWLCAAAVSSASIVWSSRASGAPSGETFKLVPGDVVPHDFFGYSVASDDLVLHAISSSPGKPGLFFQGDERVSGGSGVQFGDGLRCAEGNVVKLQVAFADVWGTARTTVRIALPGAVAPGEMKRYQWWYRDPSFSPCGNRFNLSNGIEVSWGP